MTVGWHQHPSPPSVSFVGSAPTLTRTAHPAKNTSRSTSAHLQNRLPAQNIIHHVEKRRRRGALHASQRNERHLDKMSAPMTIISDDESIPEITQYTINDSICPPTDPDTLKKIVQKHIDTFPKYLSSRPIANHTAAAFEEALDFVIQYGQSSGSSLRTKVILDSGCGTGRSSCMLGEMYPDCVVIGIE